MQDSPDTEQVARSHPLGVRLCDFWQNVRLPVRLRMRQSGKVRPPPFAAVQGARLPARLNLRLLSRTRCDKARWRATAKTRVSRWPQ